VTLKWTRDKKRASINLNPAWAQWKQISDNTKQDLQTNACLHVRMQYYLDSRSQFREFLLPPVAIFWTDHKSGNLSSIGALIFIQWDDNANPFNITEDRKKRKLLQAQAEAKGTVRTKRLGTGKPKPGKRPKPDPLQTMSKESDNTTSQIQVSQSKIDNWTKGTIQVS